jgi:hypothetical protein
MPTTGLTTRPQAATQTPTASPATTPAAGTAAPATPSRIVNPAPPVLRLGAAAPKPAAAESKPKGAGAGQPLAPSVRGTLEKRFGVDLSAVRVHTEQVSSAAVGAVSARAFTRGTDIFLGKGERPTDLALIAHEVAHVVQQRGAPKAAAKAQRFTNVGGDALETEAQRASSAVVRGEQFTVRERTAGARLQRWGVDDALNKFADLANMIPGYRMFTIVLGVNPINMSAVERSAANIIRAIVEFLPGGGLVTRALDTYGVFEKVGAWVEGQIKSLGMTGSAFRQALMDFIHSLSWTDVFDLGGVWERAKAIFTAPVARLISFAKGLITGILDFIRDAVLKPLAQLAQGAPGYDLLKAVLGKDPITGEAAEQSADALIGGFMKLIGQEEVWANIKRGNAIARAFAWFKGALSGVLAFVRQIPGMIMGLLRSITIEDFLPITNLFGKVVKTFGGFLSSFGSWALAQVIELLKIIFDVVAPSVVPYIMKAAGAFKTIVKNPIGFVGNLVRAGIQGFKQFGANFLNHLRKSLIDWLTGTLSGAAIYIPQSFSLKEIIKFGLSVLGLTWENIRQKLVKATSEPIVAGLETAFKFVSTLVKEGPAAAWQEIKDSVGDLKGMVMDQIMSFVKQRVVEAAIQKLVTSLNPAGAFIQAVIAIYNTIMFFVERLQQIARVVAAFIDSISAIAAGNIGTAANSVETTMGGLLTLVISFLARLAGLGKVSDAVLDIVKKIRAPIDKAIDSVIAWIVSTAKKLFASLFGKKDKKDEKEVKDLQGKVAKDLSGKLGAVKDAATVKSAIGSAMNTFRAEGLKALQIKSDPKKPGHFDVEASINPITKVKQFEASLGIDTTYLQLIIPKTVLTASLKAGSGSIDLGQHASQSPDDSKALPGKHAERQLIDSLTPKWSSIAAKTDKPDEVVNELILKITRSPCTTPGHNCAGLLSSFAAGRSGKEWGKVKLRLQIMTIYYGNKPQGKKNQVALSELAAQGHALEAWDVLDVLKKAGVELDESEAAQKGRKELERRIKQTQDILGEIMKASAK